MTARIILALVLCSAWPAAGQPVIADSGVTNAASYAVLQVPGAGIAPGSIVVIFGTGLGPNTLQSAPGYPLQPDLAGTSVTIGSSPAYMVYTSATQVAVIVPSTLQPGTHQITVTFSNRTSPPVAVPVTQTDFGIFTRNSAGYGQAAAQTVDPASRAVITLGLASSVRPGEPVILYGTGLGAISGAPDDRPPGVQRTTAPVEVVIGGRVVPTEYAGRSPNFAGLDQINFTAPTDIGPDCYVPLAVRANGRLSNIVSVPVTGTGRNCPHSFNFSEAALRSIDSGGTVSITYALAERRSSPSGGGNGAGIGFAEVDPNALEVTAADSLDPYAPTQLGTCAVFGNDRNRTVPATPGVSRPRFLDAGATIRLSGPSFSTDLTRTPGSSYGENLPDGVLRAGTWTYSGSGGADVGAFQLAVDLPDALTWTNTQGLIDRTQPLRIEWTLGGIEPVRVVVSAGIEDRFSSIECLVRPQDRSVTIPATLLSALPSGGSGGIILTQSVTRSGFSTPLARGGVVDGSLFRIVYQTSATIQAQ